MLETRSTMAASRFRKTESDGGWICIARYRVVPRLDHLRGRPLFILFQTKENTSGGITAFFSESIHKWVPNVVDGAFVSPAS